MSLVKDMDPEIKEMDSAIPLNIAEELRSIGLDTSDFAMAYWRHGEIGLLNVAAHWAVLTNNNKEKGCTK